MNNIELAKTSLNENNYSLVLAKENKVVHTSLKKGLQPLIDLYHDQKQVLEGSHIADKVIGKAAALILIESNINELYAELISDNAIEILDKSNIRYEYKTRVKEIRNRDNTDMCPMEKLSLDSNSADELIRKIEEKFNKWPLKS